nr:catenin alpha-2-like [Manis javanica]
MHACLWSEEREERGPRSYPPIPGSMTSATSPIILKWDPKSLEIRTLTVERLLEPLVTQVTTLVNTSNKGPSGKKKGRSKKAHVLAASVEQATQNFLEKGEQIAKESQDLKEELVAAVEDVRKQGETMRVASSEFADDPCSSVKRGTMVRAARALLSAVTRLLILADMADVMRLLSHLKIVEEALEAVKNATNEQDLANRFKEFGKEMVKLNYVAARRQQELKDPHCRDEMAAARGALKKNATMLYTASQAFLRHPDVAATRANRDYVFKQVQEAIAGISSAAQATSPTDEAKGHTGIGELAAALNEFDNKIILDPMTFSEARFRPSLEERLESIISGAALMADSSCTRDDRRERIVAECNAVRQALQDLLSEYMNNVSLGPCCPRPRGFWRALLRLLGKHAWRGKRTGCPHRESARRNPRAAVGGSVSSFGVRMHFFSVEEIP